MNASIVRFRGIDGLRGLAAVLVLFSHVAIHFGYPSRSWLAWIVSSSGQGLSLFFCLSGFLLYRPFVRSVLSQELAPDALTYFRHRILRILPGYWSALLICSLLVGLAYSRPIQPNGGIASASQNVGFITSPFLIILNLLTLQTYLPFAMKTGIGPAWSLTVEVAFYVTLPLLAHCSRRVFLERSRLANIMFPVITMFTVGMACRLLSISGTRGKSSLNVESLNWGRTWHAVFARSLLAQSDLFALGMAVAVIVALWAEQLQKRRRMFTFATLLSVSGLVFFGHNSPLMDSAFAAASASAILWIAIASSVPHNRQVILVLLESSLACFLGRVSYGIYLWHTAVIWIVWRLWPKYQPDLADLSLAAFLVLMFTTVLAWSSFYFIERPALNWGERRFRKHTLGKSC